MVIKESSDELNPPVATSGAAVSTPRDVHTATDYLALAIATCGVGYLPLAPGTWGSLVGVALWLWNREALTDMVFGWNTKPSRAEFFLYSAYYSVMALQLVIVIPIVLIGIWAASRTEKLFARKDPGKVVIDELAGQYIALLPVPFSVYRPVWLFMILAFILFRFFDIVKPYPARKMESLEGGLGIMADDIVAGIYAAIGVALVVVISWFI